MIFSSITTTCLIKAGGFLFGKIAPTVERWIEAPRVIGSIPVSAAISLCRTTVVQLTVNERVGGSSPPVGAGM